MIEYLGSAESLTPCSKELDPLWERASARKTEGSGAYRSVRLWLIKRLLRKSFRSFRVSFSPFIFEFAENLKLGFLKI